MLPVLPFSESCCKIQAMKMERETKEVSWGLGHRVQIKRAMRRVSSVGLKRGLKMTVV